MRRSDSDVVTGINFQPDAVLATVGTHDVERFRQRRDKVGARWIVG